MAFDFKTATPDTSFPAGGFLLGADSQSATDPSIYSGETFMARFNLYADTDTLEMRNSTTAQTINIYNTYTDASNYERGFLKMADDSEGVATLQIGVEGAGTGSNGLVDFQQKVRVPYNIAATEAAIGFNSNPAVYTADWGFTSDAVGVVSFVSGATARVSLSALGIKTYEGRSLLWGSTMAASADVGITRDGAAGLLKVTDGSTGNGNLKFGYAQANEAYTVATLPGTPAVGMVARVTDANAPAVGSTVAGSGAAAALVWYNGTNWTVIGV